MESLAENRVGRIVRVALRHATERRGGLGKIRREREILEAVSEVALHRLRPGAKTERTMAFALAPTLSSTGVESELVKPRAAPSLDGSLVADEVLTS